MKSKMIIFAIAPLVILMSCTNASYRKGARAYNNEAYMRSICYFESYLEKKESPDAEVKLADAYRRVNDYPNAEKWYARVVQRPGAEAIHYFNYARVLMASGKYEEAAGWMARYNEENPDDVVGAVLLASCRSVDEFRKDTTLFTLSEVYMPEVANAFSPVNYADGIIFTADKVVFKKGLRYNWTGRSYLDLYFTRKDDRGRWMSPMMLKGNINGEFHEGPATFSADGHVVYFTRSSVHGKNSNKPSHNENNENHLKIYRAELVGEEWTNVTELPFNSDNYSCMHPCLSQDGSTLYFVSNMPGSIGGTDIFRVKRVGEKWTTPQPLGSVFSGPSNYAGTDPGLGAPIEKWSTPENLGPVINTTGNEVFPYLHHDGSLYFSSDGHGNLGGLDVFITYFDGKKWLHPENLNYPLNSSADDFSFIMNGDSRSGFVSSNRTNADKIYEFTRNDPTFILSGVVTTRSRVTAIDSAVVEVINLTENYIERYYTTGKGTYMVQLRPGSDYRISAGKRGFLSITVPVSISTVGKKISEKFTANFMLEFVPVEKPVVLNNVYYDFDKWNIRPDAAAELDRLASYLRLNPSVAIELASHADARGSNQYNLILTDKRAHSAVNYLVKSGISGSRLKWKGYGETRLVNHCRDGVVCTEAEHQQNRRTEFRVMRTFRP